LLNWGKITNRSEEGFRRVFIGLSRSSSVAQVNNGGRDVALLIVLASSRASSMAKTKTMTSVSILSRRNGTWAGLGHLRGLLLGWFGRRGRAAAGLLNGQVIPFSFSLFIYFMFSITILNSVFNSILNALLFCRYFLFE
jgi:hypothetical protein